MLSNPLRTQLMGLAVSASLFGCAHHETAIVSDRTAASAQAVGVRLAAQDRENEERHRAAIAKLVRIDAVRIDERDRTIRVAFTIHNLSSKDVKALEFSFESDGVSGNRIGTTELRTGEPVRGKSTRALVLQIPYTQFGEDTGPMREALGKPQRYSLDVKEIKYADGSDAGYDD